MVEWKKLGEITSRNKGIPITARQMNELASDDGNVRVFAAGSTIANIDEDRLPKNCAHRLPSIIVKSRGYIDFEFYEKPFTHKNEMWSYSFNNKQQGKFVYYFLTTQTDIFRNKAKANSVKLPQLCVADTDNYLIPIPSLSEQQRIVSILDTFTSSISNLKQQIEERRKQYEYERDQLLDLEGKEGVEMKKLGDCVLLITDGDHQPPPKSSKGIPFVTISDIEKLSHTIDFSNTFFVPQEYYNSLKTDKKAKKGDVLYTVTGSFGIPVLIEDNREFCFQRHIALIRPNNTIALSRYIYHWLCSNYAKKQGEEKASGGAQKTVSLNSLRSFHFYYPSLQAQSRIVSILDTFEQSIANLEEQLAMREKQYEYYRNQLLTFEGEEERGKT